MKKPSKTSSPPRGKARGATLIEALAGLVVLGTLLVSITIARGRFVRQRAVAEQKIAAATAVDALVSRWMAGNGSAITLSAMTIVVLPNQRVRHETKGLHTPRAFARQFAHCDPSWRPVASDLLP